MGIPVKLEVFEGPLDLLLHLIDKNKIDIYDIPIVEITNQYMEYIRNMQREDLNIMSEFLVMAATLLDIKCRMLLPNRELDSDMILYKGPTIPEEVEGYVAPVDLDKLLGNLTLQKLGAIFQEVMKRQTDKIDPVRSKFGKIEKEEVTLTDKFTYIHGYMKDHKKFSFRQLLEKQHTKMHIVVTFLAILEMMKLGEINVRQEETCGDIMIETTGILTERTEDIDGN